MFKTTKPDEFQTLKELLEIDSEQKSPTNPTTNHLQTNLIQALGHIPNTAESDRLIKLTSDYQDPAAKKRLLQIIIRSSRVRQIAISSILQNSQNYSFVESHLHSAEIAVTKNHLINISFSQISDLQKAIHSGIFHLCNPKNYKLVIPGYQIHNQIQKQIIESTRAQIISIDGFLQLSDHQLEAMPQELYLHGTIYLDRTTIEKLPNRITLQPTSKIICPGAIFTEYPNQSLTQIFQNNPEKYQQFGQNITDEVNHYTGNY